MFKYWYRILNLDKNNLLRQCLEYQEKNLKNIGFVHCLKHELESNGLGEIWRERENNVNGFWKWQERDMRI